jgi:hypothetical protein
MADYVPIQIEADTITLAASGTIAAGNVVAVSGSGTVAVAGANATNWVGVASVAAVSGDNLAIYTEGIQLLVASGTVTAGDAVVPAASGKVSTLAAVTTPTAADVTNTRGLLGIALTTATDGNTVRVLIAR